MSLHLLSRTLCTSPTSLSPLQLSLSIQGPSEACWLPREQFYTHFNAWLKLAKTAGPSGESGEYCNFRMGCAVIQYKKSMTKSLKTDKNDGHIE